MFVLPAERWPSGLRQQFAKLRWVNSPAHGSESHPLRRAGKNEL